MSFQSYRRLERDLFLGYHLLLMRDRHRVDGFRGAALGKGFRAYLAEKGIEPRQAYRLIHRYMRFAAMWARVHVSNEKYEPEGQEIPTWFQGHFIMAGMMVANSKRMCDQDRVTNAEVDEPEN